MSCSQCPQAHYLAEGDVAMCTICYQWHTKTEGRASAITPKAAAALSAEPITDPEAMLRVFAAVERGMQE